MATKKKHKPKQARVVVAAVELSRAMLLSAPTIPKAALPVPALTVRPRGVPPTAVVVPLTEKLSFVERPVVIVRSPPASSRLPVMVTSSVVAVTSPCSPP